MKKETKALIGIFALTLLAMSSLGITPSLGLIMVEFPDASASMVQQLTGIPNLMGIVGAVVFSALANKVPRKCIALAAPTLIAIGGLLPVLVPGGLGFLLVCSGILGLGVGMVTNTSNLLITDLIPAEKQEAAMARNVIFVNVGSIFMTVVGGMLSAGGWRNNYLIYLVAVPVLILVFLCVPWYNVDVKQDEAPKSTEKAQTPLKNIGAAAVLSGVAILCYNAVYSTFPNNVALILTSTGLGDSTTAGLVTAVGTVGGIIAGLTLDHIVTYIKRVSLAVGLCVMGVAMIVLGVATNMPLVLIASFFIGFTLAIGFAQCPFIISIGTSPNLVPAAMGIYSAASSLGGFLSPLLMNALSGIFAGGSATGCVIIAGIVAIVAGCIMALSGVQGRIIDRAAAQSE